MTDAVERVARAIWHDECAVLGAPAADRMWSIDHDEYMSVARAALAETLRLLLTPSGAMLSEGADAQYKLTGSPGQPGEVWRAMLRQFAKEQGIEL